MHPVVVLTRLRDNNWRQTVESSTGFRLVPKKGDGTDFQHFKMIPVKIEEDESIITKPRHRTVDTTSSSNLILKNEIEEESTNILTDVNCFICEECGYRSAHMHNLKRHIRKHTGERPFACDKCEYRAALAASLKSHMNTHTGKRSYVCDECGYTAVHITSLRSHKRIHTGEKPFACDECEFKTAHFSSLRQHIRIHSGEEPYVCDECGHRAKHISNLRVHKKTHKTGRRKRVHRSSEIETQLLEIKMEDTSGPEEPFPVEVTEFKIEPYESFHEVETGIHSIKPDPDGLPAAIDLTPLVKTEPGVLPADHQLNDLIKTEPNEEIVD